MVNLFTCWVCHLKTGIAFELIWRRQTKIQYILFLKHISWNLHLVFQNLKYKSKIFQTTFTKLQTIASKSVYALFKSKNCAHIIQTSRKIDSAFIQSICLRQYPGHAKMVIENAFLYQLLLLKWNLQLAQNNMWKPHCCTVRVTHRGFVWSQALQCLFMEQHDELFLLCPPVRFHLL